MCGLYYFFVSASIVFQVVLIQSSPLFQDVTPSQVEELYQTFLLALNSTYKESYLSVGTSQNKVEDAVTQALYQAEYYLTTELTVYNWDDFEDLIRKAKSQGTNYDRCESFVSKFSTLDEVFYPGLIVCINTTGNTAENIFKKNFGNLKCLHTNIPNVTAEINSCGTANQTCLKQISSEISQLNSTIPREMVEISTKSNSTADEYLPKVQNCTDNSRKELRVMARTLMAEYEICAGLNDNNVNNYQN